MLIQFILYAIPMIISKFLEFEGNTLTYDYWEEMEEYRNNRLKLLADLSDILQYTLKYGWHSGSSQLYP